MIKINDVYSIIKGSDDPLSCDVAIIDGNNYAYIFEAGANDSIADELNSIDKNKVIIISHFHQDHLMNVNKLKYKKLYIGDHTYKYTRTGDIVDDLNIDDGVRLHLFKLTNSHCKGSIGMIIDDYCFIGDALAPTFVDNNYAYNVQKLKEEIDILTGLNYKYIVSSHSMDKPELREAVLERLNMIYLNREKNNPYIKAGE